MLRPPHFTGLGQIEAGSHVLDGHLTGIDTVDIEDKLRVALNQRLVNEFGTGVVDAILTHGHRFGEVFVSALNVVPARFKLGNAAVSGIEGWYSAQLFDESFKSIEEMSALM